MEERILLEFNILHKQSFCLFTRRLPAAQVEGKGGQTMSLDRQRIADACDICGREECGPDTMCIYSPRGTVAYVQADEWRKAKP